MSLVAQHVAHRFQDIADLTAVVNNTVDFRNLILFFWAETLAHWNPTSCQKNIHNQFVRIWDSQIENSKIEIMETDRSNNDNNIIINSNMNNQ